MKWAKPKPKSPGYYWIETAGLKVDGKRIVELRWDIDEEDLDLFLFGVDYAQSPDYADQYITRWAGPITDPDYDEQERREIISALRDACSEIGDNDWPDDLHIADIIEKHLARHL